MLILGCSSNDKSKEEPNNIPEELIGKWKITEIYETDGGSDPQWRDEDTGYVYDYWFKSDGTFLQSDGILNGLYNIDSNNNITVTINTSNTYYIEYLNSDLLILDLLNFEPLKVKYTKVNSENE